MRDRRNTGIVRQSNTGGVNIVHAGEGDIRLTTESSETADAEISDAYAAIVRSEFCPIQLRDRDDELAELTRFCSGPYQYLWLQAPPYSGKTALAAWFVSHPPPQAQVVSFFIRSAMVAEANSDAFIAAMIEQLSAAARIPRIRMIPGYRGRGQYWDALEKAAAIMRERGQRLVMVVDGLDEDSSSDTGIAALLPPDPPSPVRVIVSSRPYPDSYPAGIASDHPLKSCRILNLLPSSYAQDSGRRARQELDAYLAEGDADTERVLGFITASGGGLAVDDLADLTGQRRHAISRLLTTRLSRILQVVDRRGRHLYAFAHAEIKSTAQDLLSDVLAACTAEIHTWAEQFSDLGWPDTTPEYLLGSYASMLSVTGDRDRLAALAQSNLRHERMRERTGADMMALREIADAQQARTDSSAQDLAALALIAVEQYRIASDNRQIPWELPAVWAKLGDIDRGEALAHSIAGYHHRQSALADTAVAAAAANPGRAERIAHAIEEPDRVEYMLSQVAAAAATAQADEAERIAHSITDQHWQAHALTDVAAALTGTDSARAARLAAIAADVARSVPHQASRAGELARIAVTTNALDPNLSARLFAEAIETASAIVDDTSGPVRTWVLKDDALSYVASEIAPFDLTEAERIACMISGYKLVEAVGNIALRSAEAHPGEAARLAGESFSLSDRYTGVSVPSPGRLSFIIAELATTDPHMAEQIARSIPDTRFRELTLSRIAVIVAATDNQVADRIARSITDPAEQAEALAKLVILSAGNCSNAQANSAEAERIVQSITDDCTRSYALGDLSVLVADYDLRMAERIAQSIIDPRWQHYPLENLAVKIAHDDPEAAKRITLLITDPWMKSLALTRVAATIANNRPELAAALCVEIENIARSASRDSSRSQKFAEVSNAIAQASPVLAERISRLIEDAWLRARTFVEISAEILETDPSRAARLREEAQEIAALPGTARKDRGSPIAGITGSRYRHRRSPASPWTIAFMLSTDRWPSGIAYLVDFLPEAAVVAAAKLAETFEDPQLANVNPGNGDRSVQRSAGRSTASSPSQGGHHG